MNDHLLSVEQKNTLDIFNAMAYELKYNIESIWSFLSADTLTVDEPKLSSFGDDTLEAFAGNFNLYKINGWEGNEEAIKSCLLFSEKSFYSIFLLALGIENECLDTTAKSLVDDNSKTIGEVLFNNLSLSYPLMINFWGFEETPEKISPSSFNPSELFNTGEEIKYIHYTVKIGSLNSDIDFLCVFPVTIASDTRKIQKNKIKKDIESAITAGSIEKDKVIQTIQSDFHKMMGKATCFNGVKESSSEILRACINNYCINIVTEELEQYKRYKDEILNKNRRKGKLHFMFSNNSLIERAGCEKHERESVRSLIKRLTSIAELWRVYDLDILQDEIINIEHRFMKLALKLLIGCGHPYDSKRDNQSYIKPDIIKGILLNAILSDDSEGVEFLEHLIIYNAVSFMLEGYNPVQIGDLLSYPAFPKIVTM